MIGLALVAALRGPSELFALDLGEPKSAGAHSALVLKQDGSGSGRWASRRPIAETLQRVDLA
jgi:hypothetical protein